MGFWDFLPSVKGAKSARKTVERATNAATTEIRGFQDLLRPNVDAGSNALKLLSDFAGVNGRNRQTELYRDFQTDPGFQANTDFGVDSILQKGHAMGLGKSGGTRDDVGTFASRMMQGAFSDRMANLYKIAGLGQNAMSQYGNATSNLANVMMGGANSQAGYKMAQGNGAMSGINTGIGLATGGLGAISGLAGFGSGSGGSSYGGGAQGNNSLQALMKFLPFMG